MGTPATATALRRTAAALAVGLAAALAGVAGAAAQTPVPGGTAAPGTPAPGTGEQPAIGSLSCRSSCAGLVKAASGSAIRLTGTALAGATTVVFMGGRGPRDDVQAPVSASTPDAVDVTVPARARSGTLRVVGANGRWSKASAQRLAIGRATAAAGAVLQARADVRRVFLDGRTQPSVSYFVGGRAMATVRVDLVRQDAVAGEVLVASWTPPPIPAGTVGSVAWDGTVAPVAPPEGRYEFRVTPLSTDSAVRAADASTRVAAAGFLLVGHAFPIQGPHTIGTSASQVFGAGRQGHTHQGQDVFAACGTPLVAVTSGVVRYVASQAAAGNYLVLRGDGDGTDWAYMHLRDTALVPKGAHVTTGQLIGFVGDTGDADGCHLHFEKWPAPGWYTGGAPVDPLADLTAWETS